MKSETVLLLLALLTSAPVLCAETITLVQDQKPKAVIVLAEKPTRSAQMGAFELQHHLELITGTKLQIVRGKKLPSGMVPIRIGGDNAGLSHETSRVKISDTDILLTGNDTKNDEEVDYADEKSFPKIEFEFKGSLYAVYDFLEKECGVRFYSVGKYGTTLKKRNSLEVSVCDRTYCPPLDAFRMVHHSNRRRSKLTPGARETALWRLRWRMSDFFGRTNHNMYSIYFAHWGRAQRDQKLAEAFSEKRPEYFADGYKGKFAGVDPILRGNYPEDADIPPQLCYSNPGTVAYYAAEAARYFDGKNVRGGWKNFHGKLPTDQALLPRIPGKPFFYPIQGGDTGGFCQCRQCQESFRDQPEAERVGNRKFQFIANVARKLGTAHPGAGISTLAYNRNSLIYPKGVELPENVSVQLCLTTYTWYHPGIRNYQEKVYKEWIKREAARRPITLWTYIFSTHWDSQYHFGNYKSFPGLYPWKTAEQFKTFTGDGIRGWFTEVELQYNSLEAYVANRICFDPSVDPDKIIDEYFQNYYGTAGAEMKAFYREIENAYWDWKNYPATWREAWRKSSRVLGPRGEKHPAWGTGLHSPDVNWAIGNARRMDKLEALIKKAEAKVSTPAEKARLNQFINHIWQNARDGYRQYAIIRERKNAPAPALSATRIPDAKGDATGIDWKNVPSFSDWKSASGERLKRDMKLRAAMDEQFLYLYFFENSAPGTSEEIWMNNIELFFASKPMLPTLHFAVSPAGEFVQLKHELVNDAPRMVRSDFGAKAKVEQNETSWRVGFSIPMANLPKSVDGAGLVFNLMRTRRPDGEAAMFSPIYSGSYLNGIDAFGRLLWPENRIQESAFRLYKKGFFSGIAKDPAASNGQAAFMKGNASWAIQCPLPSLETNASYSISMLMRTDAEPDENLFTRVGIYDKRTKKTVKQMRITSAKISGKAYREVTLESDSLTSDMYIYVTAFNRKEESSKIYLDCIRFVKR